LDWQRAVFAERPRRSALLGLTPQDGDQPLTVLIHRNTPAEFLLGPLSSFLAFGGWSLGARLGAYDDSLLFQDVDARDVDVLWLDWGRYLERMSPESLVGWVSGRLGELRRRSRGPILVAGAEPPLDESFDRALAAALADVPGLRVVPRLPLARDLGEAYFDARLAGIGATTRSDAAFVGLARELGLVWLPAALRPRLKALAVDLDDTLYRGVLGEDGPSGLVVTPSHLAVQRRILALREEGLLLALVSKNEPDDVEALFRARADFPLRLEHFSALEISWGSKDAALARAAGQLRIGLDTVLFVDDNPGELATVATTQPEVSLLHAADPDQTLRGLRLFPGLARWTDGGADGLRNADLAANTTRMSLIETGSDPKEYFRSLQVRITFARNPQDHLQRLIELSGKTNQFNLALRRFSETEVGTRRAGPGFAWASAASSDKLSDSGIVLGLFAQANGDTLLVEDLCISCRALGRGLEDLMVTGALNGLMDGTDLSRVAFRYARGPRNAPARDWLSRFAGVPLAEEGAIVVEWQVAERRRDIEGVPVHLDWRQE
jgi:FkbH-like protein